MACAGGSSLIYQLNDESSSNNLFTRVWQGPPTMDLYPVMIAQPAGPLVIVTDAPVSSGSSSSPSPTVWQMSSVGTSDFVPRCFLVFIVIITITTLCETIMLLMLSLKLEFKVKS